MWRIFTRSNFDRIALHLGGQMDHVFLNTVNGVFLLRNFEVLLSRMPQFAHYLRLCRVRPLHHCFVLLQFVS